MKRELAPKKKRVHLGACCELTHCPSSLGISISALGCGYRVLQRRDQHGGRRIELSLMLMCVCHLSRAIGEVLLIRQAEITRNGTALARVAGPPTIMTTTTGPGALSPSRLFNLAFNSAWPISFRIRLLFVRRAFWCCGCWLGTGVDVGA